MKFALHFGNTSAPDGEDAKRLAIAAEAAGFESVIAVEHVVWPTDYRSTYPYSPTGRLPGGPETKMPDLNAYDIEAAKLQVAGTARQMGVRVR